jgi:hypothetical protein
VGAVFYILHLLIKVQSEQTSIIIQAFEKKILFTKTDSAYARKNLSLKAFVYSGENVHGAGKYIRKFIRVVAGSENTEANVMVILYVPSVA